ncbi:MAG: hypothetical protein ACO331_13865 [Prochlorothrix sp.]
MKNPLPPSYIQGKPGEILAKFRQYCRPLPSIGSEPAQRSQKEASQKEALTRTAAIGASLTHT